MIDETIVGIVLFITLILFIWGKWRYDIVALLALLSLVFLGIVPAKDAFFGFGHPAVITVAAVLVVSRGLENSGLVILIANWLRHLHATPIIQVTALTGIIAILSAFMNNIGALAILMPVALVMARENNYSPSLVLMPLAFGSLLGGMMTMIGTPPNIIIANFRVRSSGYPFEMFDFTPVGLGVAIVGILFISLIGWRLIPKRKGLVSPEELFEIETYLTELRVPEESKLQGVSIGKLEESTKSDVLVMGIVRNRQKINSPSTHEKLKKKDVLIVETDSEGMRELTESGQLELVGDKDLGKEMLKSDSYRMMEAVITPRSSIIGKHAGSLNLRWRFGIHLLAVARQGVRIRERLNKITLRSGDVLLLRGKDPEIHEALSSLGCLPLAERGLRIGAQRNIIFSTLIFAIAILCAAFSVVPVQISFVAAAVVMYMTGIIRTRELYENIDWPIIVLLGAMIPVGRALETTGGAEHIAGSIVSLAGDVHPLILVTLILTISMFLSDLINNAAAAILMAPIGIQVAQEIKASPDPFLMSVAIGASCAFLTPIGHQSNALVFGPGGYKFQDYWKLGLPLEILIIIVSIPLLAHFWPL